MITKHKDRYLLVEPSDRLSLKDAQVENGIIDSISKEMGLIGILVANPKVVYQHGERAIIIRVNRGYERNLILALSFIKEINGKRVGMYTIRLSGTVRTLTELCNTLYKS